MPRNGFKRKRLAAALMLGSLLLQVGPCTGDAIRDSLSAGSRSALNAFFASFTDQIVTEILGLP